jgi:hypothetical protein
MKTEADIRQPGNMRPTHFRETSAPCAVCGKPFLKRRAWAQFCGDPCRKAYHKNLRVTGIDTNIRKDIAEIKAKLDYLIGIGATK